MASLKLEHIYKVYPNGHKAVSDFNMEIEDGEFIVFVGPSGCGKSTTLRMVAGLEDISSGELYIGDTLVNDMQPKDRDIAMVFQNYALYPHMTVYENMAFGLTLRKVPRTEIHEKVMWAADVLGLTEYLDRKPKAMSGGQRQRVSLGRAILRNPKVMLLDEPLSNLDAKLRSQMRSLISKLHQQLKTTFIYVTHDQVEAMTLGTRVVVMKLGRVQQIDTPQNLYDHPANKFVAGFIGTPQMNFFNVRLKEDENGVAVIWKDCEQPELRLPHELVMKAEKRYLTGERDICLGFRCEHVSAEEKEVAKGDNIVNVTVSHFEELGNETLIYGDLKEVSGLGRDSSTGIIIKASSKMGFKPGDVIQVRINVEKIQLFDAETEKTIIPLVPETDVLPVSIVNDKMTLFGTVTKPESIPVDYVKNGTITIPLTAITVGEGNIEGEVKKVEVYGKKRIALINSHKHKLYVFIDENVKVGDKINFSVDYSRATFKDEEEKVLAYPLIERDNLMATFVNFKTAYEETQNPTFVTLREQRIAAVNEKYAALEAEFATERDAALAEAQAKEQSLAPEVATRKQALNEANAKLQAELKEATAKFHQEMKEIKIKHKEIFKTEIGKIEAQYKKIWEAEKADYEQAMIKNKDPESRRARKMSWSIFKESFPQMKANDIERKTAALEFDKETEINGVTARYNQTKAVLKSQMEENKRKFEEETFPHKQLLAKFKAREKELMEKKKDELLHAELLFFFKYDGLYQVIPDDITNKIIQGLGNKVFTKVFRVEVPHNGYVEDQTGPQYVVATAVNYGDVKMYKCNGEAYGEKVVVYINKEREMELGEKINLLPDLSKTQIYEDELNIRLY